MRRSRSLAPLLLVAAALLLAGLPAEAAPAGARAGTATQAQALTLLGEAAQAVRARAWSGTQSVATWHQGSPSSEVVELRHDPEAGTQVRSGTERAWTSRTSAMDADLLTRLADSYVLRLGGTTTCAGRTAQVVEARRPDGGLAARFLVDRQTGLPLGRETWDDAGAPLSSSRFVTLSVGAQVATPRTRPVALDRVELRSDWPAPTSLPGGFRLFDAGRPEHGGGTVQHLAYSDGLSTVSVFSQPGRLGSLAESGYDEVRVGRTPVWVQPGVPTRAVWAGDGQVFTLVSDAGTAEVLGLVRALPHDAAPEGGLAARLHRGLVRVGSAVGLG